MTGPLSIEAPANADALIIGSPTKEGGDISVYGDTSGEPSLKFDADFTTLTLSRILTPGYDPIIYLEDGAGGTKLVELRGAKVLPQILLTRADETAITLLAAGRDGYPSLKLGSLTKEGGNIEVYGDALGHRTLLFDADSARMEIRGIPPPGISHGEILVQSHDTKQRVLIQGGIADDALIQLYDYVTNAQIRLIARKNADALRIGDADKEGGDISVYGDTLGHKTLFFDGDRGLLEVTGIDKATLFGSILISSDFDIDRYIDITAGAYPDLVLARDDAPKALSFLRAITNGAALQLGQPNIEGGDIAVYRDALGNLQFLLDADALENALAMTLFGQLKIGSTKPVELRGDVGQVLADLIDEVTLDAGVTIDGVLLKDNYITFPNIFDPPIAGGISGGTLLNFYPANNQIQLGLEQPYYWLTDWEKRAQLTIDHNDIDGALSNFPVLIYLSASSGINGDDVTFIFDELGANRKKIAITTSDGLTQCYVEIEKWDSVNKQAWLWVKVPNISATADTVLYIYYDNSQPDNTDYVGDPNSTPAENVWDSNYVFVSHMQDDPDTSHIRDSTSNDNDGTKTGANDPIEVAGKIGDAQDFDAADSERIDIGYDPSLDMTTKFTLEAWINPEDPAGIGPFPALISRRVAKAGRWNTYFMNPGTTNRYIYFYIASILNAGQGEKQMNTVAPVLTPGTFTHVVCTYDATLGSDNMKIYINGVLDNADDYAGTLDQAGIPTPAYLGNYTSSYLYGISDENRISKDIARSADWIKATYETGRDHLVDFGTEETGTAGGPWVKFKEQMRWLYDNGTVLTELMRLVKSGQLQLPIQGSSGGILVGGDANIYRSAADVLKTDDQIQAVDGLVVKVKTGAHSDADYTVDTDGLIGVDDSAGTERIYFRAGGSWFYINKSGGITWNELKCPKCNSVFEVGDEIVMVINKIMPKRGYVHAFPIHKKCG